MVVLQNNIVETDTEHAGSDAHGAECTREGCMSGYQQCLVGTARVAEPRGRTQS